MPSHKTTPETAALLSRGTPRTWNARALCVGADPELFFPPAMAQPSKPSTSARCAPFAASAWRTRSRPTSRSASGAVSIRRSGRTCTGSFGGGSRLGTRALAARCAAGTAPLAGPDRRECPVVASHGPRRPGHGSTCGHLRPPGAASLSRRLAHAQGTRLPPTIRWPPARRGTERRPGTQTPTCYIARESRLMKCFRRPAPEVLSFTANTMREDGIVRHTASARIGTRLYSIPVNGLLAASCHPS